MPQFVYYFNGLPLTGWVFKIHDFFRHGFDDILIL